MNTYIVGVATSEENILHPVCCNSKFEAIVLACEVVLDGRDWAATCTTVEELINQACELKILVSQPLEVDNGKDYN